MLRSSVILLILAMFVSVAASLLAFMKEER